MGLLILGRQMSNYQIRGQYLGTERLEPTYIERPNAIEINKLWDWYIHSKTEDETLRLSDLDKAWTLIKEYRKWGLEYQLLEAAPTAEGLQIGRFIGYDLSVGHGSSMLSWGMTYHNRLEKDPKKDKLRPITLLTERYFQPKLNEYGLFSDLETVTFLFDVLCAIQRFHPDYFESNLEEFEPVALGIVEETSGN